MRRSRTILLAVLFLVGVAAAAALIAPASRAPRTLARVASAAESDAPSAPPASCACELRSWIVAGRGRHMYAKITCPEPLDFLSTIVEFGSGAQRVDFIEPIDLANPPRVAKMSRGYRIRPIFGSLDDARLEATYEITPDAAAKLQRDRMFTATYVVLGTNSNSGMRAAFTDAGLELPEQVLAGAGVRGEFPGVNFVLAEELPKEHWRRYGVPGPEAPTAPEAQRPHGLTP